MTIDARQVPMWQIYFLILAEGFISIAVEVLAIRQVVPFAGSNIVVTSVIIGGFLLSLAVGYAYGGRVTENLLGRLESNLIKVQCFIVLGLSTFTLTYLDAVQDNTYLFLVAFVVAVICPTTFMLGQTVPILANYFKTQTNGQLSGSVLFLSTIGSFLGSIITAAVLMNTIGVSNSVSVISAIATVIIVVLSLNTRSRMYLPASLLLTALSFVVVNNSSPGYYSESTRLLMKQLGLIASYDNAHSTTSVYESEGVHFMRVNGSASSSFDRAESSSSFEYVKYLDDKVAAHSEAQVLVIGAGAFTLGHTDRSNSYLFVDIDGELKDVAEKEILGQPINGKFIKADARRFLRDSDSGSFDLIVSDAYTNASSIPASLVTVEYVQALSRVLKNDGTAFFNIIMDPTFSTPFARHMSNTLLAEMHCLATDVTPHTDGKLSNVIFECRKKADQIRYTDDRTNLFELARN